MPVFVATYAYDPAASARLDEVRPAHREWLATQPGLLASGPTDAGGAVLVWEGASAAEVEAILDQDPFHPAGVVAERTVVGWDIVRGRWLDVLDLG